MTAPSITRAEWTFVLMGDCVYCGKPCRRQRTLLAEDPDDAQAKADIAMTSLCHRKCGGY